MGLGGGGEVCSIGAVGYTHSPAKQKSVLCSGRFELFLQLPEMRGGGKGSPGAGGMLVCSCPCCLLNQLCVYAVGPAADFFCAGGEIQRKTESTSLTQMCRLWHAMNLSVPTVPQVFV